jgi:hypothetical protein
MVDFNVSKGDVVFTKGGKLVRDDAGNLLRIPFDKFNPIEKSVDKEIFMKNPHYMNYEILDFMRNNDVIDTLFAFSLNASG